MSSQSQTTALDAALFRQACGQFATGVCVVTVVDQDGHPHGMTVNSFVSVSLDPPLVLVSIDRRNAILGHFLSSSHFGINVLNETQEPVSRRFSSPAENRFEGVDWTRGESGVPRIGHVLTQMECKVTRTFEEGDHSVLIGRVIAASCLPGKPLLYYASGYRQIGTV